MSKVKINTIEFDLDSYYLIDEGVVITLINTTVDQIENAVRSGDGTIVIGDDFHGYGYSKIQSIVKNYGDKEAYVLTLKQPTLEEIVARHTDDISVINGAIEELATLVGGSM